jgi:hypothetical protein
MPKSPRLHAKIEEAPDLINSPPHYTKGRYETIDIIEDVIQFYPPLDAHLVGEIIRYLSRAPHKGTFKADLNKAGWYLNRLIANNEEV